MMVSKGPYKVALYYINSYVLLLADSLASYNFMKSSLVYYSNCIRRQPSLESCSRGLTCTYNSIRILPLKRHERNETKRSAWSSFKKNALFALGRTYILKPKYDNNKNRPSAPPPPPHTEQLFERYESFSFLMISKHITLHKII